MVYKHKTGEGPSILNTFIIC